MIKSAQSKVEYLVTYIVWGLSILLLLSMIFLIYKMVGPGFSTIRWDYFLSEPLNSGRSGGISSILISTLLIVGVCLFVAIPIGLGTAIWLTEFTTSQSFLGQNIRRSLDILAGVPSIVFGLFGNALFCRYLGLGFSIISGGLTLACMVLPILIRSIEVGIRSIPSEHRFSASALGLSTFSQLYHLILPLAVPGIVVGLVLGIGRAVAETAALVFTSGYVDRMPSSISDSGRSLSVHIYDLSMNVPGGESNAYKSVFVILILLFFLNTLTMFLADRLLARKVMNE